MQNIYALLKLKLYPVFFKILTSSSLLDQVYAKSQI